MSYFAIENQILSHHGADGYSINLFTLSAATSAVEWSFQSPITASISQLGFRQGTVTGTNGSVFRISLQTVDSSYFPTGTYLGATNTAYNDYTATSANNSTWQKVTLSENADLIKGVWYSMVIKYVSGTALSAGTQQCSFSSHVSMASGSTNINITPLIIRNTTGSRARTTSGCPHFALYTTNGDVAGFPLLNAANEAYNANTAGFDEYGIAFSIPSTYGRGYILRGVTAQVNLNGISSTIDMKLYDSDGNLITSENFSTTALSPAGTSYWYDFLFDTNYPTLKTDTKYYITLFNNSTANNMILRCADVNEVADFKAWRNPDITMNECKRLNAGAFSEVTTRRPLMLLVIDDNKLRLPALRGFSGGFNH